MCKTRNKPPAQKQGSKPDRDDKRKNDVQLASRCITLDVTFLVDTLLSPAG